MVPNQRRMIESSTLVLIAFLYLESGSQSIVEAVRREARRACLYDGVPNRHSEQA